MYLLNKAVFVFLCLCTNSLIAAGYSIPACPKRSAIQAEKFSIIEYQNHRAYSVSQISTYGTDEQWVFTLEYIYADNDNQALERAAKYTALLSPGMLEEQDDWFECRYIVMAPTNREIRGVAVLADKKSSKHLK